MFYKIGIKNEGFSPHSFRAGFITERDKKGGNIIDGMNITGHNDIKTFMNYHQSDKVDNEPNDD